MNDGLAEFERLAGNIVRRWLAQNGHPPLAEAELAGFSRRLWTLVVERGLPRPLAPDESGAPGGMPEAESAPLAARAAGELQGAHIAEAARQLVKACFYPEFRICRDSFREPASDGVCRRQELARVRSRLSGSHCVDCPHWVEFSAAEHERFLTAEWRTDPAEFLAHRDIFLPEDFRALRQWLRARARGR